MPKSRKTFSKFAATGLVLAFPALVLVWLVIPGTRPQDALARRWQSELTTLSPEKLAQQMRQIADLEDAGLPVLAESLLSDDEEIADAALSVVEIELVRWRTLDAGEASAKVALLAKSMAQTTSAKTLSRRRAAAEVAARLLAWPIDRSTVDPLRLLAHCETVLRAAAPAALESETSPARGGVEAPVLALDAAQSNGESGHDAATTLSIDDDLAYSSLASVAAPALPPRLPTVADNELDGPTRLATHGVREEARDPTRFEPPTESRLSPRPPLAELDDLSLMHQLQSADTTEQTAAERELMRRGFTALRLRVARRLTDPDPQARRELVDLLPQMSGLDARPWLLWLSQDDDSSVRQAAANVLATSTDPKLLARLRELRSQDALREPPSASTARGDSNRRERR